MAAAGQEIEWTNASKPSRVVVDLERNFHAEVREGVRICLLQGYDRKFPDIPTRVSYRERVVEEIARQKGTPTEHHLRIVLEAVDDFRVVSIGG